MENFWRRISNLGNFGNSVNVPYTPAPKAQVQWYLFESYIRDGGGGGWGEDPPFCYFVQQEKATKEKPANTPTLRTIPKRTVANILTPKGKRR